MVEQTVCPDMSLSPSASVRLAPDSLGGHPDAKQRDASGSPQL